MKNYLFLFILLAFFISCNNEPTDPDDGYEGYVLSWSDEFNSNLDPDNWVYETGDGTDYGLTPGWGNSERQIYTSSSKNSIILGDEEGNSVLAIIAKQEPGNNKFSSAKITTNELESFRYGRIEARIKVPSGKGLWPAFWMLGDNRGEIDWPGCGEIDIMEVLGHEPNILHSTVHYANAENKKGSKAGSYDFGKSLSEDYHIYRMDWTPETITFYLDDILVNEVFIDPDMKEFLRSFYIIFNIAVGGNWPGDPDETTVFPQRMLIDWVRVYTKEGFDPPEAPALDIAEETIGSISFDLPKYAFNESLNQFENLSVKAYGDGGEPSLSTSDITVDGDSSLVLSYPGNGWGGAYFILDPVIDATDLAGSTLKFSLRSPAEMTDLELKLESVGTNVSLFIANYICVDVGNGYLEYSVPMSDFEGLELSDLKIPFALWNPTTENGDYLEGDIMLDNIYFE